MMFKLIFSAFMLFQWEYCFGGFISTPKTLDLSNRGITREDFFTKIQFSNDMREVTELILRGNELDRFIDCSTSLKSLETLDLSYNKLETFFFLCSEEETLLSLNVSHNNIYYIDDKALSYKIIQLKTLDVSFNDIYVVNDTMLQHMKNLEFLSLASNPIQEMDQYVFQNLTKLTHLNLRNTSSLYFSSSMFEPLINLEYLDLSWNPIEEIPYLPFNIRVLYICGTNIAHLSSFVMPNLRVFYADHSPNLTSVLLNDFENLTSLEHLSFRDSERLSRVYLRSDPTGMLSAKLLPNLKTLSLQNCALETLEENLLPIVQKTAAVDLQNNPWRCDCNMKWINTFKLTTDLINSFRCTSPPNHYNRLLNNITDAELVCKDPFENSASYISGNTGRILYSTLLTCLALVAFGLSAVAIVYYSRGCLGQWISKMRHQRTDTVSYSNFVESHNDMVQILPNGDNREAYEA
ncbi:toll-like receptor 13 [Phymastichus coffea]|uniref:toll-like receptor 13 n=1 Tax=Phymastichus coffea TaxID=108790 RepID=UPI00273B082F|nr:toll-like receptor 13 [Phymastichus coffea]